MPRQIRDKHYPMTSRFPIERIQERILNIRQSPVIIQVSNGACGFGEAATIGGPSVTPVTIDIGHHTTT